jgi:glycerol-3-phosphate acyltransferase PlsY
MGTLAALASWIVVTFSTRMVSAGSLAAALTLPLALLFVPHQGGNSLFIFTGALALFVFWAHRSNIQRIMKGEEHRFGKKKAKG